MHSLLHRLLEKRRVDPANMTEDEKATFDGWNAILTGKEVTVAQILEFCRIQKEEIEKRWENLDNQITKNERLVLLHTVYSKLIRLITAPEAQREVLERQLQEMLDST